VMVLHDLNLAARYASELIAVHEGRIHAAGTPSEVITPALVAEVFGLNAQVIADPVSGAPLVIPVGRYHRTALAAASPEPVATVLA
jgi:iron complex transport system ATP-binding protein